MLTIDYYEVRLEAIYFKLTFNEAFTDLDISINSIIEASSAVRNSQSLSELLELVLVIGNYMNGTGFRGGAYGFKIHSLTKLIDTKAADNKTTLVHYIADVVTRHFPHILKFIQEISSIEAACRVSYNDMVSEYNEMNKKIKAINESIDDCFPLPKEDDPFRAIMKEFMSLASERYGRLQIQFEIMNTEYATTVTDMGEDATTTSPEEFFNFFKLFITNFKKAQRDNALIEEQRLKAEKKRLEIEAREKAALEKKQQRISASGQENGGSSGDQSEQNEDSIGVMDKLLESLKTGGDYNRTRRVKNKVLGDKKLVRSSSVGIKALEMLQEISHQA
ncbi:actin-binding FH2 [Conidiobolus coronatus NRRL 28638]|uniref:Actin-binding FH2 n=1 Tax=Conidiobolus coronatus (strain ATCC 28846 / CBS 209.66 / NRRL 28638) TaxID=796925 RepID=A0A137NPG7_CONC2|nr:actin-binding FH2 [Conidiobolus coronatus NRRL 28638]|eukprot:KXN64633.1 actin-binding FH2 [Conidiobolus coronatus NRRL 28638]